MERLEKVIRNTNKQAALIPFLTAGDPDFDTSLQLFQTLLQGPADVVEIGIPYSDPLADGPVIQAAALRSLRANFQLPHAFDLTSKLREQSDKGLVLFTYINPVLQYTPERFFRDAAAAGADGVIIPDLPYEESNAIREMADAHGIALVPLVAPTSGEERVAAIAKSARGFVYCVAALGVTGERARVAENVEALAETARRHTHLPIAVGFGVSNREQAKNIASFADGVIIGSAFIRRIEGALNSLGSHPANMSEVVQAVGQFAQDLSSGLQLGSRV